MSIRISQQGHRRAKPGRSPRRGGGFTLVELLVVVTVVALLVAILMPYMGGVHEYAYAAQCRGNLQQVGVALCSQAAEGSLHSAKMPRLTTGMDWYPTAMAHGSQEILECPKDSFRITGGASPAQWFTSIEPPPSARFDETLEHAKEIRFWKERESYRLPQAVTVDIHEPGYYSQGHQWQNNRKTIPAGTVVDIWFCHYDSVGSASATSSGTVTFTYEVLGLIVEDDTLNASDDVCGYPGTVYHTGRGARGFEDNGAEQLTFHNDRRTVTAQRFQISSPGEEIRFLVSAPATVEGQELRCSYGISGIVRSEMTRRGQVLIVEYDKLVADVDGEGTDHDLREHLQPRHFGKVNTLFVSGAVRAVAPDDLSTDDSKPTEIWQP